MTVGARNSVPSLGAPPPSCMRPDPGRGGGVGHSSFASLALGGFGDAAADDVAVLPFAIVFLGTVEETGGAGVTISGVAVAVVDNFGLDDSMITEGASLFTCGEGGTEV